MTIANGFAGHRRSVRRGPVPRFAAGACRSPSWPRSVCRRGVAPASRRLPPAGWAAATSSCWRPRSLFAAPGRLVDFLAVTAIAGGLLGLAILAGAPIGQPATGSVGGPLRTRLRRNLPYGPAIAAGGLWIAATQAMS